MTTALQPTRAAAADEAVIFLHVPKTAGTTLNRLIEWEYPLFKMYSVDPVFFRWSAAHLRKLPKERLRKLRVFKGHMLFGLHEVLPQPATYITVLRDPIERTLSAYYFMRSYKLHPMYRKFKKENWTLEDFVNRLPRENVQTKIVAGAVYEGPCTPEILEQAKRNLDQHFSVVGLSERFEETLALMMLRFGWQLKSYSSFNVTRSRPKKGDIAPATLELIKDKNSFDVQFYDYAAKLFQEAVDNNAAEVARIARELSSRRERAEGLGRTIFSLRAAVRKAVNRAYSTF